MGIVTILPSDQTSAEPDKSLKINDLDPTGVMRFHSLLTGFDIFELSLRYNYNPKAQSNIKYELQLPDGLKFLIAGIEEKDIKNLTGLWNESREIQLYGWSLKQTETAIRHLIDFCSEAISPLFLYMELC